MFPKIKAATRTVPGKSKSPNLPPQLSEWYEQQEGCHTVAYIYFSMTYPLFFNPSFNFLAPLLSLTPSPPPLSSHSHNCVHLSGIPAGWSERLPGLCRRSTSFPPRWPPRWNPSSTGWPSSSSSSDGDGVSASLCAHGPVSLAPKCTLLPRAPRLETPLSRFGIILVSAVVPLKIRTLR